MTEFKDSDTIQIDLNKEAIDSFHQSIYALYDSSQARYDLCVKRYRILQFINDLWQNYLIDREYDNRLHQKCVIDIESKAPKHSKPYKSNPSSDPNEEYDDDWITPHIAGTKIMIIRKYKDGPIIKKIQIPSVIIFGSISFGIDSKHSDIDIALPAGINDETVNSHNDTRLQQRLLRGFLQIFRLKTKIARSHGFKFKIEPVLFARVPIIKLDELNNNLSIDIGIKSTQIPITKLLSSYCSCDERIKIFISTIKYWAKQRKISDAMHGFPNSFGFVLLSIKFLQLLKVPIIPIINWDKKKQKLIHYELLENNKNKNTQTLYELFISFFDFYWRFKFSEYEININDSRVSYKYLPHYNLQHDSQSTLIIQDPLSIHENVTRSVKKYNLKVLKYEFFRAYKCVENNNFHLLMNEFNSNQIKKYILSDDNIFERYKAKNSEEIKYSKELNQEITEYNKINSKYMDNNNNYHKNKNKNINHTKKWKTKSGKNYKKFVKKENNFYDNLYR